MGRASLALCLVLLIAADVWSVAEVWRLIFNHGHRGGAAFWGAFALVVLIYAGLLWLTIRVARRLRAGSSGRLAGPS